MRTRHRGEDAGQACRQAADAFTRATDTLRNQVYLKILGMQSSSRNRDPVGRTRHRSGDAGQACRQDADAFTRAADTLRNQVYLEFLGTQSSSRTRHSVGCARVRTWHGGGDAGPACREDADAFKRAADTLRNQVYLEFLGTQSSSRNRDPLGRARVRSEHWSACVCLSLFVCLSVKQSACFSIFSLLLCLLLLSAGSPKV